MFVISLWIMLRETGGGSVHSVKEITEVLVVASKEIGLGVHADKSKYMAMSQDQKAGQSHNVKIDNS